MSARTQPVTWPPRLVGALFDGPLPLRGKAYLSFKSLTVLIGANGSGKTTSLRVLREALPALVTSVGEAEREWVPCTFFVSVTDDQLELLAGEAQRSQEGERPSVISWRGPNWPREANYRSVHADTAVEGWLASLEQAAADGPVRAALGRLADSRILAVDSVKPGGPYRISWCLDRKEAEAVGLTPGRGNTVSGLRSTSSAADSIPVLVAPLGTTERTMLPTAVAVPRDLDDVRRELRDAFLSILVHLRWAESDRWAVARGVPLPESSARYGTRAWLAEPDAEVATVSNDAKALARLGSALCSRLAPGFVSSAHAIDISIEPIYEWERGGPALHLGLRKARDVQFPMKRSADGHKVWLQLALLETTAILRRYLDVLDGLFSRAAKEREAGSSAASSSGESYLAAVDLLKAFAGSSSSDAETVEKFLALRNVGHRLYLIDEPEQHLHPRLLRSAAEWLAGAGTAGASQAVVVTHSPHYLRIPGDVGFAYLRSMPDGPTGSRSVIEELTPELLAASDDVASEMGYDRGELLSAVAAIVFVEGQADKLFLEAFCARELHHAGVALIPIHGAVSAQRKGVVDSEVVLTWTAARLGVLLDNLSESEWSTLETDADYCAQQARKASKTELKAMAQILERAREVGRTITPIGIAVPDIFDLLDEGLLAARYEAFPGHAQARASWDEANAKKPINWKAYYRQTYGIEVEPALFGQIGAAMASRGLRPPAISELVERLKSLTVEV